MRCVNGSVDERHPLCRGHEGASKAYNRAARHGIVKVVDCSWGSGEAHGTGDWRIGDGACVAEYQ
eukprot:5584660-Prymnesium_polylepis.1